MQPTVTGISMRTAACEHKLCVQRQHRGDAAPLEPVYQAVDVHKISIDALQVDHIRVLLLDAALQRRRGQQAAAITQTRAG